MNIGGSPFQDLVSGARSRHDLWARVLKNVPVQTMAEIGVWKGEFAERVLKRRREIRRYYMIDPWARLENWNKPLNVDAETFDDVFAEAMRRTAFAADRVTVLRGRTQDVIDRIPDASLDFAYIDGDHTLRGIVIDLIRLLPKIRKGGLIGGDDFTGDVWQHGDPFEPTLVCPFSVYFAEAMDLPIAALAFNQFVIEKSAEASFSFLDVSGSFGDLSVRRIADRAVRD